MKQQGCFIQKAPLHTPKAFSVVKSSGLRYKKGRKSGQYFGLPGPGLPENIWKNEKCIVLRYLQ